MRCSPEDQRGRRRWSVRLAGVLSVAGLVWAGGLSCQTEPVAKEEEVVAAPTAWTDAQLMERGQRIVGKAFAVLSSNLKRAINEGGITNALRFCSINAVPLTRTVGDANDVKVRRVSHKPRNPANLAGVEEQVLIGRYQARMLQGARPAPLLVRHPGGKRVYYAPIILNNPVCLNCHGEPGLNVKPADLAVIRELYPQDQAIGFKLGELRGMWRVEFSSTAAGAAVAPR